MSQGIRLERYKVTGERLLQRIKELVHQGNIRRIIIRDDQDRAIVEFPLTLGVVGAVLLPMGVAVGAIAALAADYTLEVEKIGAPRPRSPSWPGVRRRRKGGCRRLDAGTPKKLDAETPSSERQQPCSLSTAHRSTSRRLGV